MRRFLAVLFLCGEIATTQAQRLDPTTYSYPIGEVAGMYSANFGEIRPGHFHAGIDIKTDGVEGKPVLAIADGYISRLVVTASGYGRALYITHTDGTTAIYGHLQRYRDDLEQELRHARYQQRSNNADLYFDASRFAVRKGEVVAFSGNSGSSFGPHLHFALLDTPTPRYLNLVRKGIIRPKDTLPPRIMQVHYVETDTVGGVCLHSAPTTYPVVRGTNGRYRLTRSEPIPTAPCGYFIVEVSDRRNGVENTFGVWRLTASLDGKPYFEYRMDGFLPSQSRYSDAVSYYPLQLTSRNEVIRLAQVAGAPDTFYPTMHERGIVHTNKGESRRLRIEAEDDCGNSSSLEFTIVGDETSYREPIDSAAILLPSDRATTATLGRHLKVQIPAGALYEPLYGHLVEQDAPPSRAGVVMLSPLYRLFSENTPLFSFITVTIRAEIPRPLQLRASLASVDNKGRLSYVGGSYREEGVTAQTRTSGGWLVVADTLPPRITPLFTSKSNLRTAPSLRFQISDNFSGITSCTLTIDGEWVPCDRLPVQGILFHRFDTPPNGKTHRAELVVTDASGNSSRRQEIFYR